MRWYAYNGDADGICSMVQWGLVYGIEGHRVTGVKRDIELLERVNPNPDDEIIVMDISLARNHARAVVLSSQGFDITWFDHHLAGEPIDGITTNIDTSANVCTARIVEKFLGVESDWAQVALHGDGLSVHSSKPRFKELGELLNYNGYGADLSDLHFHPDDLLLLCLEAKTPQNFMDTQAFMTLKNGFESDLSNAKNIEPINGYYLLPNEAWARRVVGVMAHRINESGDGPHVIAIDKGETLQVSIRGSEGIGELCKMFGGGGRATAGGIDALPKSEITALMKEVNSRRSA
jgi:nanoRNase/pAp phosphatase (c-di-AMP/oligoRNAs hydrolase)